MSYSRTMSGIVAVILISIILIQLLELMIAAVVARYPLSPPH